MLLGLNQQMKTLVEKGDKVGVAFKDIGVWIGIKCVIASLRQARPLCRDSGHTSRGGHKIKWADVLPQSRSYLVRRP